MQLHDTQAGEPLDFLQAWSAAHSGAAIHRHHRLDAREPVQAPALLSTIPRSPPVPEEAIQALLGAGVCITLADGPSPRGVDDRPRAHRSPSSPAQRGAAVPDGDRVFTFERPAAQASTFDFALALSPRGAVTVRPLLKRARHGLDVDGPNTASLGCKKRRLRTELITSRLSHAYSQPATHILNREGQKLGDKRFLKMAATSIAPGGSRRTAAHVRATSYVRFSTMNRLRQRLGLSWPLVVPVTDAAGSLSPSSSLKGKEREVAGFDLRGRTQSRPLAPLITASRGQFVPPEGRTALKEVTISPISPFGPFGLRPANAHHLPTQIPLPAPPARLAPRPPPPPPHPSHFAPSYVPPSGLTRPASSPERHDTAYDELDEDTFAAHHHMQDDDDDFDDDGFYHGGFVDDDFDDNADGDDDAPGRVYSDFGVIFGSSRGGDGGEGETADEDGSYEEFLDELDGISWVAI